MKQIYFSVLLFIFPLFITAQEIDEEIMINYAVKGYIVMDGQDTTWGKVKLSTRANNELKVKFLADSTSKWKTYKAKNEKVIAYGYATRENGPPRQVIERWRHFLRKEADEPPIPFASKIVFMEVKAIGVVNLYSYYIQSNTQVEKTYYHYYIIEQKYSEDVEEYRSIKVTRDNFEKILSAFAEDCKKVENIISIYSDYSRFGEVIKVYNECQMKEIIGCPAGYEPLTERQKEVMKKRRTERMKQEQKEVEEKFKTTHKKRNNED